MDGEKKVSFSLSSSSSKAKAKPPSSARVSDEDDARAPPGPQFVTEFDASQTLAPAPGAVIPPLPNSGQFLLHHRARKPSSLPTDDEVAAAAAEPASTTFVLDTSGASDAASSHIPYGLTVRAPSAPAASPPAPPQPPEDPTLKRFKEDMSSLPEDRGFDEFKDMPVDGYGAALLAGYGWSEGKGIGRNNTKGDTEVKQYDRRGGTQGLGYNPSEADPKKSRSGDWIARKKVENGKPQPASNGVKRDRDHSRSRSHSHSHSENRSSSRQAERETREKERGDKRSSGNAVRWLRSHIRVRVITEKLGGRFYLKKGEVTDVVGPTTCDLRMDEGRELLQGVEQEMLETALPRRGGAVLVLYGRHKGVYGSLVERNSEEETGVVQDADTKDMINVRLEQVAEYIGDPELLGY